MAVTMDADWVEAGVAPAPVSDATYVVAEQPIAEYDNWFNYSVVNDIQAVINEVINAYGDDTILRANTANNPTALTVGQQTVVGRVTGGSIDALPIGIADDDVVQIDGAANVPVDNDYAKFTANGLEGQSYAELRSDVGVIFEESGNVIREHLDGGYNNDFVFGSPQLDDNGEAYDSRMFFDKSKGAFRVGRATGTEWDAGSVGDCSHAEGRNTIASGYYSHAEGRNTIASGYCSHAEGRGTIASDYYSHAEGCDTIASAYHSHAEGHYSEAFLHAQHAKASGRFAVIGDAQLSNLVAQNATTTAAQTELFLDGSSVRAVIPADRTWGFTIDVTARQTVADPDGVVGHSARYELKGLVKRTGATTEIVGSPTINTLAEDNAAWGVTVVADDGNDALVVKVTGAANMTIHWVAAINLVEVG